MLHFIHYICWHLNIRVNIRIRKVDFFSNIKGKCILYCCVTNFLKNDKSTLSSPKYFGMNNETSFKDKRINQTFVILDVLSNEVDHSKFDMCRIFHILLCWLSYFYGWWIQILFQRRIWLICHMYMYDMSYATYDVTLVMSNVLYM